MGGAKKVLEMGGLELGHNYVWPLARTWGFKGIRLSGKSFNGMG